LRREVPLIGRILQRAERLRLVGALGQIGGVPGAFTAATFKPPRSLLTTRVASASPSTSSATISSGLPVCTTASRSGSSSCRPDSFFS
jgi:hypothetical protein